MDVEIRRVAIDFYDAGLVEIEEEAGVLVFNVAGTQHSICFSVTAWWKTDAVGHSR